MAGWGIGTRVGLKFEMYSDDDIQYALETTEVLLEPDRRIDTFGTTVFEFHMISELMDSINEVRIRRGSVEAARPLIVNPSSIDSLTFEGFGTQAEEFANWLKRQEGTAAFLKYGFNFKQSDVTESLVHDSIEDVRERVVGEVNRGNNPLHAVIEGVDDTWELSLLRFTVEMIQKSHGINMFDFKRRGLL